MTATDLPTTGTVDAAELFGRLDEVRVLDVRTAAEFGTAHIPGSYHVPLDTLGEHCPEICRVDSDVVLVCQSGARADQAAQKLSAAGMTGMRVLTGGINAWTGAGGEVIRGEEKWAMDRQVRLVAGSISLTGILLSTKLPRAKWLAGFVGAGLTFSALSNTCAMANLLGRLPYNRGSSTDVAATVDALIQDRPAPLAA